MKEAMVYAAGAFRPSTGASVSVFDHGLLYGDGVFEGIRAYNGRVFKLEEHVDRLFDSAKAIRLEIPQSRAEIVELVLETCRQNDLTDGYIRLVVTRGAGDLGIDPRSCPRADVIVIAKRVEPLYRLKPREGVRVVTASIRRPAPDVLCPGIKSLNYLNNIMARIEANDRGADEALLLDQRGYVAEATVDNVFIVAAGMLLTPPVAVSLKGITRQTVMMLAAQGGIPAEERPITLLDVWTASEAFMCGTMAEIVPIVSVDGRVIGSGAPGPIASQIAAAYQRVVHSSGSPIHRATPEIAAEFR
jgi:branched-chain amino acid aminotransferase